MAVWLLPARLEAWAPSAYAVLVSMRSSEQPLVDTLPDAALLRQLATSLTSAEKPDLARDVLTEAGVLADPAELAGR